MGGIAVPDGRMSRISTVARPNKLTRLNEPADLYGSGGCRGLYRGEHPPPLPRYYQATPGWGPCCKDPWCADNARHKPDHRRRRDRQLKCDRPEELTGKGDRWPTTCWVCGRSTGRRSRLLAARARTWGSFRGLKASAYRLVSV